MTRPMFLLPALVVLVPALAVLAAATPAAAAINRADAARLQSAAHVVRDTWRSVPIQGPQPARCVAVFPAPTRPASRILAARAGVMSCRGAGSWSAPMFMELTTGHEASTQPGDVVLLVMHEDAVQKLLSGQVVPATDASIAAYSRARAVVTSFAPSAEVLRPDADANRRAYGPTSTPRTILAGSRISAPTEAGSFLSALDLTLEKTPDRPSKNAASPASSSPATTAAANVEADLRSRIVRLQQMLDQLAGAAPASPVGTTGTGATVVIDRAKLVQLRREVEALLGEVDATHRSSREPDGSAVSPPSSPASR